MKILHIAECAGGVDKYLKLLLPRIAELGIEQTFLCSNNFTQESYKDIVTKVIQLDLKQTFSPIQVIKKVKAIRSILKSDQEDIIYCHSSFAGGLGRLAAIGCKGKVVYNPHGWAFNMKSGLKSKVYLVIEKLLSRYCDKIVCISEAEKASALKKKIAKEEKLALIPNGIDISAVQNAVSKTKAELAIPADAYVVGMIGRLTPQKAPDIFIKAAKLILQEIPQAYFIIVGNGEETEQIKQYAEENGIPLLITGWVDNPYEYLKLFDLGMLLSRWEGFGLAIAEYMAAEKSIIATRVDAIPTLIKDGVDGLLVEVDSPTDIKDKVMYLYNHPQEAALMRGKALEKVKTKYSVERVVEDHLEMFQKLI